MRYDILLWDVDGTLMDFKQAEAKALSQSLKEIGVEPTEKLISEYSRINISYWKRLETGELTKDEVLLGRFVEFLGKMNIQAEAEAFLMSFEEHLGHIWFIQDNSLELCKKLRREGLRQYVVTNGWVFVQKTKLRESGFDQVIHSLLSLLPYSFSRNSVRFAIRSSRSSSSGSVHLTAFAA